MIVFQMNPPRRLEGLLADFTSSVLDKPKSIEDAIEKHHWASKFLKHLEERDLDEVTAFKFLVLTQPLLTRDKKQKQEVSRRIVSACGQLFLESDSADQLCLSNPVMAEALRKASERVRSTPESDQAVISDDVIELVLRARGDPDVWLNGVEPKFMRFLAHEILLHIPLLCEDKNVLYAFVRSKHALG